MFGKYRGTCKVCGIVWEFEGYELSLEPYPHGDCPYCGNWVAVF